MSDPAYKLKYYFAQCMRLHWKNKLVLPHNCNSYSKLGCVAFMCYIMWCNVEFFLVGLLAGLTIVWL